MNGIRQITVKLKERNYNILIGNGQFNALKDAIKPLNLGSYAVIITNPKIRKLLESKIIQPLEKSSIKSDFIEIPDTEKAKSIKYFIEVVSKITSIDVRKKIFIIALGGGVIGDLAGFVAAVYKRGIPYIQIPTTLLAQVDSSIGGKVAVDLAEGKNLLGAFYQPSLVFTDISALSTLSSRQILSGLAEVIKYGVIAEPKLFEFIEYNYHKIMQLEEKALNYIITTSVAIKAQIVSRDEKEQKNIRTILNFGHTIGHAIEAASGYSGQYTHGEAISIGMVAAADIANKLGVCNQKTVSRLESLISRVGLPVYITNINLKNIIDSYLHDKKFTLGKNKFVLPSRIGVVKIYEDIDEKLIKNVLKRRIKTQ